MDSLDEITKINSGKPGFFKHVFDFSDESKSEIGNVVQYAILALIPIVILNKSMQKWVPEADDEKSSLELSAEIIIQVIAMFLGILFVHRIVTYLPTYSGAKYSDYSVVNIILSVLLITLSLQTKLGEKVSIIVDRVIDLWEGNSSNTKGKGKGKGQVKVSQPISQSQGQSQYQMTNPSSMGTTSISALPPMQTQTLPDYNSMHQPDNTPLVGAATPGMPDPMMIEPMAANSFGGGFGAW